MTISVIDDGILWDAFVDSSPYGLLFHKWEYLKIMEKHTGCKLYAYGIYKNKELMCVFPVFIKHALGMRMAFSPPPYTGVPYLGPVMSPLYDRFRQGKKESYLKEAVHEVQGELNKLSPTYTLFCTVPGFEDIRPFKWEGYDVDINFTYEIDLRKPLEELWERFDYNCKKNIKTLDNGSLSIKRINDPDTFFKILTGLFNKKKLNFSVTSAGYINDILNTFSDNARMYFIYNDRGEAIFTMLTIEYGKRFMLWMGGPSVTTRIPGYYPIVWELLKSAKNDGYEIFEYQGANTPDLCLQKSKYNPSLNSFYIINKKGVLSKAVQWSYFNLVKKRW